MKKLLATILAAALLCSLAACGGGDKPPSGSQQSGQDTSDKNGGGGGAQASAAAKRLISEIDMYDTPKDDGRSGEFFSIELDANDKALGAYMCFIFDTEEKAEAFAEDPIAYDEEKSYIVGKVYFGHWKDLSGKSREEAIEYMESNDGFRSEVYKELDISEAIPYGSGIDETFFTATDMKGVADMGDHYQICYHEGNTITGLEDWYKVSEGETAIELASALTLKHSEDNDIATIYKQSEEYVVVEYNVKKHFGDQTWEQVRGIYEAGSGADQPDDEGGEAALTVESTPSGDAITMAEYLDFYGLSEDDYKPAHFIEFGKLNMEGTLGKASLGVVDIFVDQEKTTEEDIIAWYTHLFSKFQSASDTGKLYGDIRFAEEIAGFDELIESNTLWENLPSFTYYFPYPLSDGRGALMVNAAYDKENGKYSIVINVMSYIR